MLKYRVAVELEQLKDSTRGRPLTKETLHLFVGRLALPAEARDCLLALTPRALHRHRGHHRV